MHSIWSWKRSSIVQEHEWEYEESHSVKEGNQNGRIILFHSSRYIET
jgi:hypothetical protein